MKVNDAVFGKDSLSPTFDENDIKESPFRKNRRPSKKPFEVQKNQLHIDEEYKDVHGFFWVYNYALSKKWRTTVTGTLALFFGISLLATLCPLSVIRSNH